MYLVLNLSSVQIFFFDISRGIRGLQWEYPRSICRRRPPEIVTNLRDRGFDERRKRRWYQLVNFWAGGGDFYGTNLLGYLNTNAFSPASFWWTMPIFAVIGKRVFSFCIRPSASLSFTDNSSPPDVCGSTVSQRSASFTSR